MEFDKDSAWNYLKTMDSNFQELISAVIQASGTDIERDENTLTEYLFLITSCIPREQKLRMFEHLTRADNKIVLTGECMGVKKGSDSHKCLLWAKENLYSFIYYEMGRVK